MTPPTIHTDGLSYEIREARGRTEFRRFRHFNELAGAVNAARSAREMWLATKTGLLSSALDADYTTALGLAWTVAELPGALMARSLALVAVSHGEVIGGLTAGPPWRIIRQLAPVGNDVARHAIVTMMKIHTLAVLPDYRGNGVGCALVTRAVEIARLAGARVVHGQFDTASGQAGFYGRCGFTVHDPGIPVEFSSYGIPAGHVPGPGESLFSMALATSNNSRS
ncbi:GNAT family N-acetyltransferase [Nocardia mexicana]|uniref:Acetyltransferase (GNAT) family protein n=1 Tax=Nocardia mexicana TaxID=279262 RepID=A0A370GIJ1_9NOCA|nr:GNAT family N-acetyltransferase [Nocardia mexicana]RDI43565.1 acetyltransferase (GNAT) family protein [Nocardia mexicana]